MLVALLQATELLWGEVARLQGIAQVTETSGSLGREPLR